MTGAVSPVARVVKLLPCTEALLLYVPPVIEVAWKDKVKGEPVVTFLFKFQVRVCPTMEGSAVVVPVVEPVT